MFATVLLNGRDRRQILSNVEISFTLSIRLRNTILRACHILLENTTNARRANFVQESIIVVSTPHAEFALIERIGVHELSSMGSPNPSFLGVRLLTNS